MAELRKIASGLRFPEGPIAMQDGSIVLVEIERGRLSRVTPDGTVTSVAETGGGPNGAAVGPDGRVYICNNGGFAWTEAGGILAPGGVPDDYVTGSIQAVDLATGAVETLYTESGNGKLNGPNDIVFDTTGGFWFTDLGKTRARETDRGAVHYAKADGSSIEEKIFPLDHPNGIGLSPDGSRLYVAETMPGRVWAWDLDGPGQIGDPAGGGTPFSPHRGTLLYSFPGYQLLDSLAVDGDGNVCVATLLTGAISVISPAGELLDQVMLPEGDPFVTNVCFGGEDHRTAYITVSGKGELYATEWAYPGLQLAYEA
jgi:gluconolactonase